MTTTQLLNDLSTLLEGVAAVDPDPLTKTIAGGLPLAIQLAQGIADPATRVTSINNSVQVAEAVAGGTLTGGAGATFAKLAPVIPLAQQFVENLLGMTTPAAPSAGTSTAATTTAQTCDAPNATTGTAQEPETAGEVQAASQPSPPA
jgi:hypothetical protein